MCGLSLGVKAPTGKKGIVNDGGERLEPSATPGSGSWDLSAGGTVEWRLSAPGRADSPDPMSVRASVGGRFYGRGTEDYQRGPDVQAHLGGAYPVRGALDILLQTNVRYRGRDDVGTTDEEAENTGGTDVYLSPGLRVEAAPRTSLVTLLQMPLYQDVNGIQIVSGANLFVGLSRSIL